MSMVDKNYKEDDDDIEIVGGSEMDKRVAEKADKNFSKMTLKAQREAAEAFRNSRDNSTEEEEEEQVVKPHKVGRRGRKRKAVVEEDSDSDIEILDSSNDKRFSTDRECISITPISITPMSTTTPISKKLFNNNNNNFSPSPTNMASWNKKPQEEEQWDSNKQSRDLVQVRSVEVVHNFQAVSFFDGSGEVCFWEDDAGGEVEAGEGDGGEGQEHQHQLHQQQKQPCQKAEH